HQVLRHRALGDQVLAQHGDLRRLAGTIAALEGDERAALGWARRRHAQAPRGEDDTHAGSSPGETTPSSARTASIVPITLSVSAQLITGDCSTPAAIRRAGSAMSEAMASPRSPGWEKPAERPSSRVTVSSPGAKHAPDSCAEPAVPLTTAAVGVRESRVVPRRAWPPCSPRASRPT